MTRKTPGRTPSRSCNAGSKRNSVGTRLQPAPAVISKACYRKIARRAGVKRICPKIYDEGRAALKYFLKRTVPKAIVIAGHANRFTITPNDIAMALKQEGITLYMRGADWNNRFFSRHDVRKRVMRPLPQRLLVEAAEARAAESQLESAPSSAQRAMQAPSAAQSPASVGCEGEREQEDEEVPTAGSQVAPAEQQAAGDGGAAPMEVEEQAAAAGTTAEEEEEQQEQQLPSPAAQQPALAGAVGDKAGPSGQQPTPAAAATPEQQQPEVHTPAPMTAERAAEVQAWMSKVFADTMSSTGYTSTQKIKTVMLARYTCSAEEVQDMLFALERNGSIMFDNEDVFLTN